MYKFHDRCFFCVAKSAYEKSAPCRDSGLRTEYMHRVAELLHAADTRNDTPPEVEGRVIALRREMLGLEDDFSEIRHRFNSLLMRVYDRLHERVRAAADPLLAAVQLSIAGNYVDFAVLETVEEEDLMRMLDEAAEKPLDPVELENLRRDLENGKDVVFLHDNCGEIVMDKLLIETIRELYPRLSVLSVVRCGPVVNDATMEDVEEIGLKTLAEVMDNGVPDTAGTVPRLVRRELAERLNNASVILSKGQGNFETMTDSGLNVYFLLLAKCPGYTDWFGLERFSAVLANDIRMPKY